MEPWPLSPSICGWRVQLHTGRDQNLALAKKGANGVSFEKAASAFHISYMIGNDQSSYQPMGRIKEASLACGYRFRIIAVFARKKKSRVTVTNEGVAPI